jgi:uncharacterized protein (TIGR02266 family)
MTSDKTSGPMARAYPRYEVNAYVDYAGKEVLLYHRIQNLSLGGISIQTPSVEQVGTSVDLVINFPELDTNIQVSGVVVWANREHPQDMGIRFNELDENQKQLLRKYINLLKQT